MDSKNPELKVRSILITQPEPTDGRSPYFDLKEKYKVTVVFRPFVKVDPVSAKDFRKEKINILDYLCAGAAAVGFRMGRDQTHGP